MLSPIVPPLPEPTPEQSRVRTQLATAVQMMRTTLPTASNTPGGDEFERVYNRIGAIAADVKGIIDRATAHNRLDDIEPGSFYLVAMITLYGARAVKFYRTGASGQSLSAHELQLHNGIFNKLEEDPSLAADMAQIAGVELDVVANAKWLAPVGIGKAEVAATLLGKLWALCVHPKLVLF